MHYLKRKINAQITCLTISGLRDQLDKQSRTHIYDQIYTELYMQLGQQFNQYIWMQLNEDHA